MALSPYKDKYPNFNNIVCSAPSPWGWGASRRGCTIWCDGYMHSNDAFSDCCQVPSISFPNSDDPRYCELVRRGCFPAGAVARLSDGESKHVEDLRPGDQVQVGRHQTCAGCVLWHCACALDLQAAVLRHLLHFSVALVPNQPSITEPRNAM